MPPRAQELPLLFNSLGPPVCRIPFPSPISSSSIFPSVLSTQDSFPPQQPSSFCSPSFLHAPRY